MYLEISPRQSGKTTRMLQHIIGVETKKAVIVTLNQHMVGDVHSRLLRMSPSLPDGIEITSIRSLVNVLQTLDDISQYRFFFDEFDFFPIEHTPLSKLPALMIQDAYFCTTPRFVRELEDFRNVSDDLLVRLLKMNNYSWEAVTNVNRKFVHKWLSMDVRVTELFGVFVKSEVI